MINLDLRKNLRKARSRLRSMRNMAMGEAAHPPTLGISSGGRLGNVLDLTNPEFGASFRARFEDGGAGLGPRKLWELCWLAQKFEDLSERWSTPLMLGLGVGVEPLIYHFAHLAGDVVATDLFDVNSAWNESRIQTERVRAANPFPYPEDRLSVRNMDMRRIDLPEESVDVVWSCSSVEHVSTLSDFVQIFREIHKVLKPGGVALITTEFSLDELYLLPGVLSLWRGCALFDKRLGGLSMMGPVDLEYHDEAIGNQAAYRADVRRLANLNGYTERPSGLCIHVGYTRFIPVAFALEKTGPVFDWPESLASPAWSRKFSAGIDALQTRKNADEAVTQFRSALNLATLPGPRLHCFRQLIEACVHAGQVTSLHEALDECAREMPGLPDDDDALGLIAYVAAGQGRLTFAHYCWDRAQRAPGVLPASRLRMRCSQLASELQFHGASQEAFQLNALADAAWCEASTFYGANDPQLSLLGEEIESLRNKYGLNSLVAEGGAKVSARAPASGGRATTIQTPNFDMSAQLERPMVYLGNERALTKTVYGHKMYVDTRSQVGACFLMDGYWEEWIVRHLNDFVKPGMRVLDLGANMGFYTLLLCDLVGPDGHVTAFEPWPEYFDILVRNVQLNGYYSRSTLVNKGVYASTGRQELVFYQNCGTGTLRGGENFFEDRGIYESTMPLSIDTVSLDDYLADNPQRIDFIKIDVDGSEPFIFRGMKKFLQRTDPLVVFCEFCPAILKDMGIVPLEFLNDLRGAGFNISEISSDGIIAVESDDELATVDWRELLLVRTPG